MVSVPESWPDTIPIPEATGDFLSPNVESTTRTNFTNFFLRFRHAEDAHTDYKHLFLTQQKLIKLLVDHPAMQPNLEQTFSTPANSKNKVYFQWDFVLRTFQIMVAKISPQNPWGSPMWQDIVGRSVQARHLILDTTGQLNAMNANLGYKDDEGVEFTDEIKSVAAELTKLGAGCAGCAKEKRDDGGNLLACARCKNQRYCSTKCQKKCWNISSA